jgi:hypothetical protein
MRIPSREVPRQGSTWQGSTFGRRGRPGTARRLSRAALALPMAVMLAAAPATAEDWPQAGHDASGSGASAEKLGARFSPGWTLALGQAPVLTGPVLADGILVAGNMAGQLVAARASTGTPLWKRAERSGFSGTPILWRGRVFTAPIEGSISALSAVDGRVLWRQTTAGQVHGAPILWKEDVVLSTGFPASGVHRFAGGDGLRKWGTLPGVFADLTNSALAASDNVIVAGDRAGRFRQLDPASGLVAAEFDAVGRLPSTRPLIVSGRIVVLTGGNMVRLTVAELVAAGATAATRPPLQVVISDPEPPPENADAADRHAVSSPVAVHGTLVAFQARFEYPIKGSGPIPAAFQLREWLYSLDIATGRVVALAALGTRTVINPNDLPQLGVCPTPASFLSDGGPVLAAASSIEARVRVIDAQTAAISWSAGLGGPSRAPITAANGMLFVATDAGAVEAFRSDENRPPATPTGLMAIGSRLDANRPTVGWAPALDPEGRPASYEVRIDDDGELLESWREQVVVAPNSISAMFSGPLADGRPYTFAVRARDDAGAWSEWSTPTTFVAATMSTGAPAGQDGIRCSIGDDRPRDWLGLLWLVGATLIGARRRARRCASLWKDPDLDVAEVEFRELGLNRDWTALG